MSLADKHQPACTRQHCHFRITISFSVWVHIAKDVIQHSVLSRFDEKLTMTSEENRPTNDNYELCRRQKVSKSVIHSF